MTRMSIPRATFAIMAAAVFSACNTTESTSKKSVVEIEGNSSFKVESMTPEGEISASLRFPSIQVQFSEPVVPLAKLGEPTSKSDAVSISPKLKGTFRWYGTSLLSFDCEEELIPQKKYTVSVNPSLKSINGTPLSGKVQFSFYTEELSLRSIDVGQNGKSEKRIVVNKNDVAPEYSRNIVVTFGNKVNAAVVSKYISITEKDGKKEYAFKTQALKENQLLLYVTEALPRNTKIAVTLKKGALPDKDCIETSADQSFTFHTLRPFELQAVTGTSHLSIAFNHRIKHSMEEAIFNALHFSEQIAIQKNQVQVNGNAIVISDIPVTYNSSYTVSLDAGVVEDVFGQVYQKEISQTITVPDADSYASFRDGNFIILESQFEPKRAFEFQNITPSSYTITPLKGVSADFAVPDKKTFGVETTEQTKNRRVIQTVDLTPFLEKTPSGFRGAVALEGDIFYGDQSLKNQPHIHSTTYIQSTDLGVSVHSSWNETAVMVTGMQYGSCISGATVSLRELPSRTAFEEEMLLGHGALLSSAVTNGEGLAVLAFSADNGEAKNNLRYIEVSTKDDRVVLPFRAWSNARYVGASLKDGKIMSLENREIAAKDIDKGNQVTHIFSDRGLYRPGETARIKIIDRTLSLGQYETYTGTYEITFVNNPWSRNRTVYAQTSGTMSSFGTAQAEWKIPEDIAPGVYYIRYNRADGSAGYTDQQITIQFFERLRFQASAEITPLTFTRGDTVTASVSASYLGGGSLSGGSAHIDWTRYPTSFTPQGTEFDDYLFGPLVNDWFWREENEYDSFHETEDVGLSAEGGANVSVKTGSENRDGEAYCYNVQALITDAGNQMISARDSCIVHPASFYIGLSTIQNIKGFPKKGEKLSFNYLLVTPEGTILSNGANAVKDKKVFWKLEKKDWQEVFELDEYGYETSRWEEKTTVEKSGSLSIGGKGVQDFTVIPNEGGRYLLTLSAQDAKGRAVVTQRSFYVTGSEKYARFPGEESELSLSTDKEEYETGETAQLLLESPLPKGRYLFTLERQGILQEEVITLSHNSSVIEVPIKEAYIPVVYASISTYLPRQKDPPADYDSVGEGMPKAMHASATILVSKEKKRFDVEIEKDKTFYVPGGDVSLVLKARKNGVPVQNAELTLMAVDRGVLDLIGYRVQNPLLHFYSNSLFASNTDFIHSYERIMDPVTFGTYTLSARERQIMMLSRMYKSATTAAMGSNGIMMMDMMEALPEAAEFEEAQDEDGADSGGETPKIRKDFRATAVFLPSLITDSSGEVHASFTLPDSLTEYVITVVGVKEQDYAFAEDSLVATNPISVRDVETRILRPGDEGEAGVVITNTSENAEEVTIAFAVFSGLEKTGYTPTAGEIAKRAGAATVIGKQNQSVTVQAGETKTIMFRLNADSDGWITLAFTAKSASANEIIYKPLEIEKPYIYETVTTLGQLDSEENAVEEKIVFPLATEDGRATLSVQLDATRLGTLSSAVNYVFRYPYGCLEQRSSAVLPLIAFGEYIDVFGLESEVTDAKAVVQNEIDTWAAYQKADGGFPYWPDARESSFAVSLRIGEIIALCKTHNVDVSKAVKVPALATYIQSEVNRLKKEKSISNYALSYAYYVLSLLDVSIPEDALMEIVESRESGASECAFAGLALLKQGNREAAALAAKKIKNSMVLTVRGASFQTSTPWARWYFYNTDSERYALSLHLFTLLNKDDLYNAHLVYQLLELQKASMGYWGSTASTARVLIALETYIKENNIEHTDFGAEALLNGTRILSANFKGANAQPVQQTWRTPGLTNKNVKSGDRHYSLDYAELPKAVPFESEVPLRFTKDGSGKLFYTASLTYAVPAEEQEARDEGLCVFVEITDTRTGKKVEPGKLQAGVIYKETVYVTTTKARTFVAVRAPVPAGAEILNAAFVTTPTLSAATNTSRKVGYMPYYGMSHQDIYDAEIRCFWNSLSIGSQSFEFLFRAQRSGTYTTPSALAECMYEPEIFGRTAGAIWNIE